MEKIITCTICPRGCEIRVTGHEDIIEKMSGYCCARGKVFARDEFILPKRIFTSTMKLEGGDEVLVPVRSDASIPKEKLLECMNTIRTITVKAPITIGDVVVENICGLGCNIVATKSVAASQM
jgi:CxxC motif-containing protein